MQCNILHCFSGNLLKHNTCNLTRADHILVYHERYIIATTITSHSFIQVTIVSHQVLHKYPGVNTTFYLYDMIYYIDYDLYIFYELSILNRNVEPYGSDAVKHIIVKYNHANKFNPLSCIPLFSKQTRIRLII